MLDKGKNEWVRRVAALNLADITFVGKKPQMVGLWRARVFEDS